MPLQKQVIQIPFQGVQTKLDPKLAPLGTYSIIDNMVMNRYPELVKRDGLDAIGVATTPSNITASYNYLNEVGVITNNAVYSYSPSIDQYQLKGLSASPIISAKPVIANTYTQKVADGAITANSVLGSVWEDSRGGVRASVKDVVSDTFIESDYLLSNTGVKPKVIGVGNNLYFFWIEPGDTSLNIQMFDTVSLQLASSQVITNVVASCFTYDVIDYSSNILVVVAETNAPPDVIKAYYWNVRFQTLGMVANGLPDPVSLGFVNSGTLPPALSLSMNPTGPNFSCTIYNDSNEVWTKNFFSFLAENVAEFKVADATTDAGWSISTCIDMVNNLYVFYSSFDTLHNSFQAKVSGIVTTPVLVYNRPFYLQLGVVSSAVWFDQNAYVILGYDSPLQNTYFGVRDDGACFGRMFSQLGGGNTAKANSTAKFMAIPSESNTFSVNLLKTTKIVSSANSYFSTTSVFNEQVFFTPSTIDNKVLGKYLNIAGGYLKQYDGSPTIFEQGFHLYPEAPVLTPVSGGSIADGSYSYVLCWEWTDNQGQIHRSEPSIPTTITLSGGPQSVTVTARTLTITNKETRFGNERTPVVLAVYRTQSLGTTYFRVNQLPATFVYNDSTVQTIDFTDTVSDAALGSNSLLYTTGGVFQNIGLPSTNLMTVGKNRIIVAGTDTEPNRVFYSKEKEEGVDIEFSNELSFIVDSLGGDITALAAMDDKILIFKKSLVYYVAGALPDKLGNGSAPTPLLISADCGCNTPQSIVLTGKGIMFESQKGIYLCDRQLNVTYIGQAIDQITTQNPNFKITSAINLPDKNLVYFTDISGQVLVYDTFFEQWYTHTLPFTPISSTILNNQWYVTSVSEAYKAIPGKATDGNALSISSKVKTNWISMNSLEGFGRIYTILIVGDNADLAHRLRVNLYYDFEEFPRQQLSIVPNSLLGDAYGVQSPYGGLPIGGTAIPYGMDGAYGDGAVYGGAPFGGTPVPFGGYFDGTYQFVVKPREQKCTSLMIEIYDEFPSGDKSKSFKFSGLSLVIGVKPMYNKNLPYTRRLT